MKERVINEIIQRTKTFDRKELLKKGKEKNK